MSMPGGMTSSGSGIDMGSGGMSSSGMAGGGMGMGMGGEMVDGLGGMMAAGSHESAESNSAIDFDESGPVLNASMFSLSAGQLAKVNEILKATHERYLKEEAVHSIISVDSSGVQTTEINPFPEQLRKIENDLWTQIDDAGPIEIQKQFRERLNLFETPEQNALEGSMMGSAGYPGMVGSGASYPGMPGGGAGGYPGEQSRFPLPGLLGWKQEQLPVRLEVGYKGRWFRWKVTGQEQHEGPELPASLKRFLREPGPWMAVANARTAYESREWMKVADCFTRTGKFRWYMADSWSVNEDKSRFLDDDQRSAYKSAMKSLSTFLEKARPADELNEQILSQLRAIQSRLIDAEPDEVDSILQESALSFSEDLGTAWFLLNVVDSGTRSGRRFEPATCALANVQLESSERASGYFQVPNEDVQTPVRFLLENGQWKIDSIGTSAELQQQVRIAQDRENGASPRAVAEACGQAMAHGRYSAAVQCMTDLARDEWIGEMLVAILKDNGMESLHSRYSTFHASPSSEQIDALMNRMKEIMPQTISSGTFQSMLENPALTANERREVTNQIAKKFPDRNNVLQLLLATRATGHADEFKTKGTFSNSSDTKVSITKTGTWTWPADSGLPSVEVRLLQLDAALWKLDTIIDPALKPWPLVE